MADLDHFEWLTLEALWGTAKTPVGEGWARLMNHPDVEDPAGVWGLVVEGNLQRAHFNIHNANELTGDSVSRDALLGRAAGHIGKLAGGLISSAVVLLFPDNRKIPLAELIPAHVEIVDRVLLEASASKTSTLLPRDYYRELKPVHEQVKTIRESGEPTGLAAQSRMIARVATIATRTWIDFMNDHAGITIDPGATPRSHGPKIESLREDFEQYVPSVRRAAAERKTN